MKKLLSISAIILLLCLFHIENVSARIFCSSLVIQGESQSIPGAENTYRINYSSQLVTQSFIEWYVTGGEIVAINGVRLDPSIRGAQYYTNYAGNQDIQGFDPTVNIQFVQQYDAGFNYEYNMDTPKFTSIDIFGIMDAIKATFGGQNNYPTVTIKWSNLDNAKIYTRAAGLGWNAWCGSEETNLPVTYGLPDCANKGMIYVNANYAPTTPSGNLWEVCNKRSITFTGAGADKYAWYKENLTGNDTYLGISPSITVSAAESTNYTAVGIFDNGCPRQGQYIRLHSVPSVQIPAPTVTSNTLCVGNPNNAWTITAYTPGATSYIWTVDGQSYFSNSATIYPSVSGTGYNNSNYVPTYSVYASNGCDNSAPTSGTANVRPPCRMGSIDDSEVSSISATLVEGDIEIVNVHENSLQIILLTIDGKVIHENNTSVRNLTIQGNKLNPGIYMLHIKDQDGAMFKKKISLF